MTSSTQRDHTAGTRNAWTELGAALKSAICFLVFYRFAVWLAGRREQGRILPSTQCVVTIPMVLAQVLINADACVRDVAMALECVVNAKKQKGVPVREQWTYYESRSGYRAAVDGVEAIHDALLDVPKHVNHTQHRLLAVLDQIARYPAGQPWYNRFAGYSLAVGEGGGALGSVGKRVKTVEAILGEAMLQRVELVAALETPVMVEDMELCCEYLVAVPLPVTPTAESVACDCFELLLDAGARMARLIKMEMAYLEFVISELQEQYIDMASLGWVQQSRETEIREQRLVGSIGNWVDDVAHMYSSYLVE